MKKISYIITLISIISLFLAGCSADDAVSICTMSAELQICEIWRRAATADAVSSISGMYALMNADDPNSGDESHF